MENFDLESSMMALIVYKLRDTMLNLINDIAEKNDVDGEFEIPKEVTALKKRLHNLAAKFDEVFDTPIDERKKFMDEVSELKDDIVILARAVNTYIYCCEQMGEYMLEKSKLKSIGGSTDNDFPVKESEVMAGIRELIDNTKSGEDKSQIKACLISAVPMRMPRANYNAYVNDSLTNYLSDLPVNFITASLAGFEDMVCARKSAIFGKYFPGITERINSAYACNAKEMTIDDIDGYLDDADYCRDMFMNVYDILSMYYCDTNYMLLLSSYVVDSDLIFEDDFILKDLYYSMQSIIKGELAIDPEHVSEAACNRIEELYRYYEPKENQIIQYIKKLDDSVNFEDKKLNLLSTYLIIVKTLKLQLEYAILNVQPNDDAEQISATKEEIKSLCGEFTSRINQMISDMPIKEQKFLKQKFLAYLPCTYGTDELISYMKYSLDGITDKAIKFVVLGNILEIFDDFNYGNAE